MSIASNAKATQFTAAFVMVASRNIVALKKQVEPKHMFIHTHQMCRIRASRKTASWESETWLDTTIYLYIYIYVYIRIYVFILGTKRRMIYSTLIILDLIFIDRPPRRSKAASHSSRLCQGTYVQVLPRRVQWHHHEGATPGEELTPVKVG